MCLWDALLGQRFCCDHSYFAATIPIVVDFSIAVRNLPLLSGWYGHRGGQGGRYAEMASLLAEQAEP
jgi:hypothetical protein